MHPNLYLIVLCFVALMQLGSSASIEKRTIDDCYGMDCYVDMDYYDNTRNIHLLASINDSVVPALPEIVELLSDNANHDELVSLMQDQQRTQERLVTLLSSMMEIQQDTHQQLVSMTNLQQDTHHQLVNMTNLQHNTHQQLVNMTNLHQDTRQQLVNVTHILQHQLQVQITPTPMQDCSTAPLAGQYTISPEHGEPNPVNPFPVVCSVDIISGGWIVIQRRYEGSVSFDRNWADYENGFGSLDGEFWLGLDKMHLLTSRGSWKLRFDLEDFGGDHASAEYDYFQVGNSASFYQLTIRSYSGTAGDSMIAGHNNNGMAFTTKDQDHDQYSSDNCGIYQRSGWWHRTCVRANVNGLYIGQGGDNYEGMTWYGWKRWNALKKTELKIKRVE